ncbi:MAG: hypothetical protein ACRDRK_13970 [Pseudonocardia sp.]
MRLVFGPHDLEEYAAARDRLLLLVVADARRSGVEVEQSLVAAALDHKHGIDGRLGHWTRAHVADTLTVRFPRTVALLDHNRDDVPAALHALLGFLADRDWLDTRSDPAAELHTQIRASTPVFHDALVDEGNHDLGTFWAVQMRRHHVSAADPVAVARFLEQVRSGRLEIDRAVLDEITRREAAEPEPSPPELPPALLPGAAQLLAAADSSVALVRLRAFTRWVRSGRRLTREGRLSLTDAKGVAESFDLDAFSRDYARTSDDLPEVTQLMQWTKQARLVRVVHGRLVQVKSAAGLLSRPIELWRRAFAALGGLDDHFGGSSVFGAPSLFGMSLGEAFPILWLNLYAAGGDPMPVELFHRLVREAVNERFGCVVDDLAADVEQRLWRRDVAALLDALELLGAVQLGESVDYAEYENIVELAGRDDPDPTLVSLTPIGLWAVHQILTEQGMGVPLVGDLAGEDIEYVCVRLAGVRTEVAEAELAAWVHAREVRAAADELARFLRRTDEAAHRGLALFALGVCGQRRDVVRPRVVDHRTEVGMRRPGSTPNTHPTAAASGARRGSRIRRPPGPHRAS